MTILLMFYHFRAGDFMPLPTFILIGKKYPKDIFKTGNSSIVIKDYHLRGKNQ